MPRGAAATLGAVTTRTNERRPLSWLIDAEPTAKRALAAASLGWALDAFDVMLFALLQPAVMKEFGADKETAGIIGSVTLVAAAVGGVGFGVIADRYGRTRALMASVLIYSVFTAASGFARSPVELGVCRFLLGLGMGGEWAAGAALVSETWPDRHRGKALALVQSSWSIGYGVAAIVVAALQSLIGWRGIFFLGLVPAALTLWVRHRVEEPRIWRERASRMTVRPDSAAPSVSSAGLMRVTLTLTSMNACALFGFWALSSWMPSYLELPPARGGVGLETGVRTTLIVLTQVIAWVGYVTFGLVADRIGRRKTYVIYLAGAAVLAPVYGLVGTPMWLFALGPLLLFFGAGHFSGFGAVTAELYPTAMRARAQGLTYNTGRLLSAAAPWIVGSLADRHGFAAAFAVAGAAYLVAALAWAFLPETRGRTLA